MRLTATMKSVETRPGRYSDSDAISFSDSANRKPSNYRMKLSNADRACIDVRKSQPMVLRYAPVPAA